MNNTVETTFGKSLRIERQKRKLTQVQLAKLLETSQQNIAGMEAGRSLPKEVMFDKMCDLFGRHSSVAQLPPRGTIKLAYDTVNAIREGAMMEIEVVASPKVPAPVERRSAVRLSPLAQELAELFDMLPNDRLIRSAAHRECTGLLLARLAHDATPASLAEVPQAHKL